MKYQRIFCGLLAAVLLLWMALPCAAEQQGMPEVIGSPEPLSQALSNRLSDLSVCYLASGAVMTPQQQSESFSPQSGEVLLMTALLTAEKTHQDDVVTIPEEVPWPSGLSNVLGLRAGDTPTTQDLLAGMLLTGAEDCAYALARYISGSVEDFVGLMNSRAKELGMGSTAFSNPAGLEEDAASTTVNDLMKLLQAAANQERLAEVFQMQQYSASDGSVIQNRCPMMEEGNRSYDDRVVGMLYGRNDSGGFGAVVIAAEGTRAAAFLLHMNPAQTYEETVLQCVDYVLEAAGEQDISETVQELAQDVRFEKDGAQGSAAIGVDQTVIVTAAAGTTLSQSDFAIVLDEESLPETLEIGGPAGSAKLTYQGQWVADIDLVVRTLKRPADTLLSSTETPAELAETLRQTRNGWIKWSVGAVLLGAVVLAAAALYKRLRTS